jgi:hypothetical protein
MADYLIRHNSLMVTTALVSYAAQQLSADEKA